MEKQLLKIENIPTIVWGKPSKKVFIYVHGKCQSKDYAKSFAFIAEQKGYQTLSFDLPEHGDRKIETAPCDIWHGIEDLQKIYSYAIDNWEKIALFGCSIGAYFALHAYKNIAFEKCIFHSPIIDMEYLINKMFVWFNINEQQLREQRNISTPIETLSWDYYRYVKENPIEQWKTPTQILFGSKDSMQTERIMKNFIEKYGGYLTVSQNSEHAFLADKDKNIVNEWVQNLF